MDIHDRVLKCVCDQLGLTSDEIALDSKLIDDLNADSLDLVELGFILEEEFGQDNGYDVENWFNPKITFGELVEYVERRIANI